MATPSLAMIPSAIADSKVYSVLPNNGDGDFQFNRDSSATRIGQNGLIQTVGYFGSELVVNGDFATDTDWSKSPTGVTISGGFANFTSGQDTYVYQDIMTIGKQYYMVLEYNISSLTGSAYFGSNGGTGNAILDMSGLSGSGTLSGYITASSARLIIRSSAFNGTITNVSVKEVTGDQPRLNYDISNGVVQSCPSLLLEPASTNLITYSEAFDNAYWTKIGLGVTSGFISPDGTLNAYKMVKDTNTGTSFLRASGFSQLATENITLSIYAKAGENNSVILYEDYSDDGVIFNLKTGTITAYRGTPVSSSMELLTNGFYKLNLTVFPNTTISQYKVIAIDNSGSLTAAGDGTSGVYIFGAQLEVLSYATSYIPNFGQSAGVTRAAETCFGAGTSSTFNSTEGVLYAEISALADDLTYRAISISNNTNANQLLMEYEGGVTNKFRVYLAVSNNIDGLISVTLDITQNNKIAYKYAENDLALWINGAEVGSFTGTKAMMAVNTMTNLRFTRGNNTQPFYGNTKDIRVFNEALTDLQLQKLTTL